MDTELFEAYKALRAPSIAKCVRHDFKTLENKKVRFLATGVIPKFTFTKAGRVSVTEYQVRLENFKRLIAQSPAHKIVRELYEEKWLELDRKARLLRAVQEKNDSEVSRLSVELFSLPKTPLATIERELEARTAFAEQFHLHQTCINADQFTTMVRAMLAHYHIEGMRVTHTVRKTIRISHASVDKQSIYIPKSLCISKSRARRLLTHEIEGHILRLANANAQPLQILRSGLGGYMQTEEGIAVYLQKKADRNEKQFDPGFWDLYATVLTQTHDFKGVFDTLAQAKERLLRKQGVNDPQALATDSAWTLCLRAYRGIAHPNKPGLGYYRDHLYREGLEEVRGALTENPDLLPDLFIGKFPLRVLPKLKELGLVNTRVPELIARKIVKAYS